MGIWQWLSGQTAEPDPIDQTGPATSYPTQSGYDGSHDQTNTEDQVHPARARMDLNRGRRWRAR